MGLDFFKVIKMSFSITLYKEIYVLCNGFLEASQV